MFSSSIVVIQLDYIFITIIVFVAIDTQSIKKVFTIKTNCKPEKAN